MSKHTDTIGVIGAGSLGCTVALLLDRLGFRVVLFEEQRDILHGAAQVTFINHGDGFEYYKYHHQRTGELCVEGSLVKLLMYSRDVLQTDVCSLDNPIRFLVSNGSIAAHRISKKGFLANAAHMHRHYAAVYHAFREHLSLSDSDANHVLGNPPSRFMTELFPNDYEDVSDICVAVGGNGYGINMPHYYALMRAALRSSQVEVRTECRVKSVQSHTGASYRIHSTCGDIVVDQAVICASHHIPQLMEHIGETAVHGGTYFLNAMTLIDLPPTSDPEIHTCASRINFTLMEKHGGMYACVVPPSSETHGIAAVYYPDSTGSQIDKCVIERGRIPKVPRPWEKMIAEGLSPNHPRVKRIVSHISRLYPFLEGYASVRQTACRPVFNVSVRGSNQGTDRRVREISRHGAFVSRDRRVSGWTAPKWTNAEVTALTTLDHVLAVSGRAPLPKSLHSGVGPTRIDVLAMADDISFRAVCLDHRDAIRYAEMSGLSKRVVAIPGSRVVQGRK